MTGPALKVAQIAPPKVFNSPEQLRLFVEQVVKTFGFPDFAASIAFGDEVADARAASVQVINRQRFTAKGHFVVLVWISDDGGAWGSTQTVASWDTGDVLLTVIPNQVYIALTDEDGLAEFTLSVTGAGTRHVHALVLGRADSDSAEWAA